MKQKTISISGSKILLWLPVACLAGFMAGSWGAREELRSYKESVKEGRKEASRKAGGFTTFANMVKIPEMARHPRRKQNKSGGHSAAAATPSPLEATRKTPTADAVSTNAPLSAAAGRKDRPGFTPDDLRARIEDAQELWRTRVEIARAQWKEKLGLTGKTAEAFDSALQEMNERLYDSVAEVAETISGADAMSPELGLRLVGETTAIMAETYDRIGSAVPQDMRQEVSEMQIVDFVDPGVAEPLIGVQGKLDALTRRGGRNR